VGRIPRVGRPAAFPVVQPQVSDHGTVGRSRRRHQRRSVGILGRQGRGGRAVDRECGVVRGRREDRRYNALRRPRRLNDLGHVGPTRCGACLQGFPGFRIPPNSGLGRRGTELRWRPGDGRIHRQNEEYVCGKMRPENQSRL
jgi:hypothetical protein